MTLGGLDFFPSVRLQQRSASVLFFLLFFLLLGNVAVGQQLLEEKYDFEMTDQTMPEGLWTLTESTGAQIVFSNNDFSSQKYTLSFQQKSLREILHFLLEKEGLRFIFEDNQILIQMKESL